MELPSLDTRVASLLRDAQISPDVTPGLTQLLVELKSVVLETPQLADRSRVAYLAEEWRRQETLAEERLVPPAVVGFLGVHTFATYFNLLWLTVA